MAQGRAKDFLDAKDYSKMLKGNVPELRESEFNILSMETIVANYRDFLVDVAAQTQRMNEGPLRQGVQHVFETSPGTATAFAKRLVQAFRFCVDKSRHFSNGKRLPPAVTAVVQVLVAQKKTLRVVPKTPKKADAGPSRHASSASLATATKSPCRTIKVPVPDGRKTPMKKTICKTPEKPRKDPGEATSPVWSLPGTPGNRSQRGVPASGADEAQGMPAPPCRAMKRPAAKTTDRHGPAMKRPARKAPADPEAPLQKVTVVTTQRSLPLRSYVQACTATPQGSKRLIVEFTETQCRNHAELARRVKEEIETQGLGFRAARELKARYANLMEK